MARGKPRRQAPHDDLTSVPFMDSIDLGVLVGAHKRARDAGGRLRIICGDQRILRLFAITGLDAVLTVTAA